jgi:hypothetical protein
MLLDGAGDVDLNAIEFLEFAVTHGGADASGKRDQHFFVDL